MAGRNLAPLRAPKLITAISSGWKMRSVMQEVAHEHKHCVWETLCRVLPAGFPQDSAQWLKAGHCRPA